jgi:hypothetical protein
MTELGIILVSDIVTFALSLMITLIGFAVKWGSLKEDVSQLRTTMATMVTKEELTSIKESLAEIKGMFVLRLKDRE